MSGRGGEGILDRAGSKAACRACSGEGVRAVGAPGEQDTGGEGMGFEVPLLGIGSDLQ